MKHSDKIFWLRNEYRETAVFIAAIIACTLMLENLCKHLLSQLTLRQSRSFEIPMNFKIDMNLEGGFNFTNISNLRGNAW